jgi:DNA-binding NarL/FixJ family response regulator
MEKIRIAIAEDYTIVRKGYISILNSDEEFEVVADGENGADLIQRLAQLSVPADVCLLDVSMPKMNGYETLLALREKYPEMRFLILTQLEHEFIVIRMLKAGASGYMLKTVEPSELKLAIKAIRNQAYYSNEQVDHRLFKLVQKGENFKKIALTDVEETFLKWCCSDLGYKQIADKMGINESAAVYYRKQLFTKLNVQSRTGLALFALKLGLVPMDDLEVGSDVSENKK